MPIANINKIYYGDTEITKVMYGETVVYESTPPYDYEIKNHEVTEDSSTAINTELLTLRPYSPWLHWFWTFEFTNVMRSISSTSSVYPMLASVACLSSSSDHQPSFSLMRIPDNGAIHWMQHRYYTPLTFTNVITGEETEDLIEAPTSDGIDTNVYKLECEGQVEGNNYRLIINLFVNGTLTKTFNGTVTKQSSGQRMPLLLGCAHVDSGDYKGTTTPMLIKHFGFNYL